MGIRPEDVRHVAELARLELREDEQERLAVELTAILDYAAVLRRLDLAEDEPAAAGEGSALREDEPEASGLTLDQALAMAPEREGAYFVVPVVVENMEP